MKIVKQKESLIPSLPKISSSQYLLDTRLRHYSHFTIHLVFFLAQLGDWDTLTLYGGESAEETRESYHYLHLDSYKSMERSQPGERT